MLEIQSECFAQWVSGFYFVSWRQEPISSRLSATNNSCKMVLAAWQGILSSSDLSEKKTKVGIDVLAHFFRHIIYYLDATNHYTVNTILFLWFLRLKNTFCYWVYKYIEFLKISFVIHSSYKKKNILNAMLPPIPKIDISVQHTWSPCSVQWILSIQNIWLTYQTNQEVGGKNVTSLGV